MPRSDFAANVIIANITGLHDRPANHRVSGRKQDILYVWKN